MNARQMYFKTPRNLGHIESPQFVQFMKFSFNACDWHINGGYILNWTQTSPSLTFYLHKKGLT